MEELPKMTSCSGVDGFMRMNLPGSKPSAERNAISSMVDIAFLLLIFFIVATTIMPTERDLIMKLPVPGGSTLDAASPVVIEIGEDSSVFWGQGDSAMLVAGSGSERELPDLKAGLRTAVAASGVHELAVMLKAHDRAPQQRFVDVLNCLAACGVENVALVDTFDQ